MVNTSFFPYFLMITDILKKLGLDAKEAEVYIALLQYGTSRASTLAEPELKSVLRGLGERLVDDPIGTFQ